MRKIKPLKTATGGYIFFDLDGIEVLLPLIKEFIVMPKKTLKPPPGVSFEEHFHVKELVDTLLANPQLGREQILARDTAYAALIGRQATILLEHAMETGGVLETENGEIIDRLIKIQAYSFEMAAAKSLVLARERQTNERLKGQLVDFVSMNQLPKNVIPLGATKSVFNT